MACFYLRPAWRVYENGRPLKEITFSKQGSQLDPDYMIPCGRCDGCAADKSRDWAIRMMHESRYHERNSFITLTYQDAPDTIRKDHIQRFLKRLRKVSNRPLKYFVTGEYGELTRRPHYHAVIFGEDFLGGSFVINDSLYGNAWLSKIWSEDRDHSGGQVAIGEFTLASACYVAGYVNKKINDPDTFSLMSRNPPLGWRYAHTHQDELCRRETVVVNGQEFPIPKVYFDWYEQSRFRPGTVFLDTVAREASSMTIEQARNREINHKAKRQFRENKI